MEAQLREILGSEMRRRHGIGVMESKIKPVHIANALMREEHGVAGKMTDLKLLMTATAAKETSETQEEAVRKLVERSRERWGRLADDSNLKRSVLMTKVLPLLRTLLGTDGAAFGTTPEMSSFSSPTALTVTRDPSDDHAGALIHRLWSGNTPEDRLEILDRLRELTDPQQDLGRCDDLTAVLAPLSETLTAYARSKFLAEDLTSRPHTEVDRALRASALDLLKFEDAVLPNPIATLQRIVGLASLSLFVFTATRPHVWSGLPWRPMLLDATGGNRHSSISTASEQTVKLLLDDGRRYTSLVLTQLLDDTDPNWPNRPIEAVSALFASRLKDGGRDVTLKAAQDILSEIEDDGLPVRDAFPERLTELIDNSSRGFDSYLRLLGIRSGLLYPQQSNRIKRLIPSDRTLEILAASSFDLSARPIEYRDFLDALFDRWRVVTGGRPEDAAILSDSGIDLPSSDLSENAERLLSRLEALGLARKLADSIAVVGMIEGGHVHQ